MNNKNLFNNNKLAALLAANTLPEADSALCQMLDYIGCGHFSYNYYPLNYTQTRKALHILCTQTVQGWQEHYTAQCYDQIDPIWKRMRHSLQPLAWKLEDELAYCDKPQKQLFTDAIEFGLAGGFAVPIHTPCGEFANLVIQDVSILKILQQNPDLAQTLQLVAHYYHARVNYFLAQEKKLQIQQLLTQREIECLHLTAQHKTAKEIAKTLAITPRTVGFHIENAIKKLGVGNKYQAINAVADCGLFS